LEFGIVRPLELSTAQLDRWSELQGLTPGLDSPYLSPHWSRAVARAQHDDPRGVRVAILSENGAEAGFFPARVAGYTAMAPGAPLCDVQALIARPGLAVDPRRLVQALGVHRLDFTTMLADHGPFQGHARGASHSYIVDVAGGYAAYEAERKAAGVGVLKDSDRKRRKAEREVGAPVFQAFSRSRTDFEQMIAWKRGQYAATRQIDVLNTPWTLRLLNDLFERREPDFGGVLFTLHFGDRLAAAQFNLHSRRTVHAWFIAHDAEFERYSPGILLFQDILRWMDETPYSRLELGPGDYRFKRELANAGQALSHGFVGLPSPATLVRRAAYGAVKVAEALPLGAASELPAKAMRRVDRWRGLR
jgi:CelD/BcsL family acetyltransferase involved in cellulose biosynthesis